MEDPLEGQSVPSEDAAKRLSKSLGCSGAHRTAVGWRPCESPQDLLKLIKVGNPAFRNWKAAQAKKEFVGRYVSHKMLWDGIQ